MAAEPDVELLLASANAIQRLIAERKALLERIGMLENELSLLRQRTNLVRDSYRKLTDEFVTQFKLIDTVVSNMVEEGVATGETPQPTSNPNSSSAVA
jgi:hypothetical protein